MDIDEREFLDPDEEYELMYADELETMRDIETKESRSDCPSRKSLNFTNAQNCVTSNYRKPNSMAVSLNTSSSSQDQDDDSIPVIQDIYTRGMNFATPSTSKQLSPLPFAELDISRNSPSSFRISVSGKSNDHVSNKRTVEELFGDIHDIDFHLVDGSTAVHNNKRSKKDDATSEIIDKDLITINRIVEYKRKLQNQNLIVVDSSFESLCNLKTLDVVLCKSVPKYAFITLRNGKNEKFYAKLHSNDTLNNKNISVTEQCKSYRLLTVPFENILMEANNIMEKKFVAEDKEKVKDTNMDVQVINESELWVEKYKPTSYMDLLSDEGTNRILLQWLKLWDKVVFGSESQVKKSNSNYNKDSKFCKWKLETQLNEELDEAGCPQHKTALLCGPPGLGKTTLAHIIAKHAGYNVVEMNASDDRSPEVFKRQLESTTQMRSVLGTSPKPNCLIIDEIDGAPAVSIDILIKFIKGELKSKDRKKGKQRGTLKRPIICICNDVYVPALRPLRQMAFVVRFPPTSQQRLAQRLVDVARIENIRTDIGAMLSLCEKTNNDIRNCISTIHCLKEECISTSTIRNTTIGVKDMRKGLFTAWQEIFQIQMKNIDNTSNIKNLNKSEAELFRTKRMISILRTVQSNGDYDRLMQGVYENFLNLPVNDSTMQNITIGLEWFCYMDHLKTVIAGSQIYTLMAYMPYSFVMWNFLFATYQKPKLSYPNLMYELYTKQTKHHQIVQEVLKGMGAEIRAYCHHEQILLDTLPLLTYIINPVFRQVSIQLFSITEKEALRQLVNAMIDYNLNFVQERSHDGSYEFNLDPNVDDVVEFPGVVKNKHLTYALKLMIAREIEQEKIRRLENSLTKIHLNRNVTENSNKGSWCIHEMGFDMPEMAALPSPPTADTLKTQNHLQKLTPKVIKESPTCTVTKDFFGRIIEKPLTKNEPTKVDEIVKSNIWFHFKEGFSNAVRRTVYIKDLI